MINAGITSPYSLYSENLVTFGESDFNQAEAEGFINIWGLPTKVQALAGNGQAVIQNNYSQSLPGLCREGFAIPSIRKERSYGTSFGPGAQRPRLAKLADAFNSSIAVDGRMYRQDITGSMAHAAMLAKCGILTQADSAIRSSTGLGGILADLQSGALAISTRRPRIFTCLSRRN